MEAQEKSGSRLHPMDVRHLLKDGKITAARVEENAFNIDRDIFDVLFPRLSLMPIEQAVYLQLYRHSFGRGLNCAQLSNSELQQLCNVSHSTVREAVKKLITKGCIRVVRPGIQHEASIYRVLVPSEVLRYDSATRVSYKNIETKALVSRAQQAKPEPSYDGPVVRFDMLRP